MGLFTISCSKTMDNQITSHPIDNHVFHTQNHRRPLNNQWLSICFLIKTVGTKTSVVKTIVENRPNNNLLTSSHQAGTYSYCQIACVHQTLAFAVLRAVTFKFFGGNRKYDCEHVQRFMVYCNKSHTIRFLKYRCAIVLQFRFRVRRVDILFDTHQHFLLYLSRQQRKLGWISL